VADEAAAPVADEAAAPVADEAAAPVADEAAPPPSLTLQRRLKATFDPEGRLNPGRAVV
jgi:FAD/FMN-containing dehydrogenase